MREGGGREEGEMAVFFELSQDLLRKVSQGLSTLEVQTGFKLV